MKQTLKSKTGSKCSICTEARVSSTKGTATDFELFRNTLKQTLTNRSMKLHENYFNPGPLTDSGFKRLSRCQANLQESDRTSGEPTVNGQSRLMAISGERTPGVERGLAYDSSPMGHQQETYAGNPGSNYFYPDFNPAVFLHRCDLTEFRRRTSFSETSLMRAEPELLYTKPIGKISREGIIEIPLHSSIKRNRQKIFNHANLISKTPFVGLPNDIAYERWHKPSGLNQLHHSQERQQKTIGPNRLNHSLIKLGFLYIFENSLSEGSKLIVC